MLLKNAGSLPLDPSTTMTVIGTAASTGAAYAAGGSSLVPHKQNPVGFSSPLDGLRNLYGQSAVRYLPAKASLQNLALSSAAKNASGLWQASGSLDLAAPATIDFFMDNTTPSSSASFSIDCKVFLRSYMYESSGVHGQEQAITLAAGHHSLQATWTGSNKSPNLKSADVSSLLSSTATAAASARTAIVVVATQEGENYDRASLSLPGYQDQLIAAVAAKNPHTVVVINSGGAVTMPWLSSVSAVVESWYPGQVSGTALANVLSGTVDPSGKLPLTFPSSDAATPYNDFANGASFSMAGPDGSGLQAGTSWYRATGNTPLFPFGYGLSYTSFSLSDASVSPSSTGWTVTVRATNTGTRTGRTVAEGYVSFPAAANEPPRQLRCFGSTTLAPGQSGTITMTLSTQSLQTYQNLSWSLVPGSYSLELGQSSADLPIELHFTA